MTAAAHEDITYWKTMLRCLGQLRPPRRTCTKRMRPPLCPIKSSSFTCSDFNRCALPTHPVRIHEHEVFANNGHRRDTNVVRYHIMPSWRGSDICTTHSSPSYYQRDPHRQRQRQVLYIDENACLNVNRGVGLLTPSDEIEIQLSEDCQTDVIGSPYMTLDDVLNICSIE